MRLQNDSVLKYFTKNHLLLFCVSRLSSKMSENESVFNNYSPSGDIKWSENKTGTNKILQMLLVGTEKSILDSYLV